MYFHNLNNRFSIHGILCFDKLVAHNSVNRTGNLMLVSCLLLGKPCIRQNNIIKALKALEAWASQGIIN